MKYLYHVELVSKNNVLYDRHFFLHNDPYNTNGSCVPIHKIAALHHVLQSLIENILKTV